MITLKSDASLTPSDLDKAIDMPSTAWFAVRALEGFTSAKSLLDSGRIKADGFEKIEKPETGTITCWRCNGDIHHPVNDGYAQPYKPKPKFNDHWECQGKHNTVKVMCTACEAVSHATYHPNYKLNALYTEDSGYDLTLDENLISFLISPPSPPFVFCMAEGNSQHVVWLASYTLDNRYLSVVKGRKNGIVDRKYAFVIAQHMKQLLDDSNAIRKCEKRIELATPLKSTRSQINNIHGTNLQISDSIYAASRSKKNDDNEVSDLRAALRDSIHCFEQLDYGYLTWYVATMYLKALLVEFDEIPISMWKKMKAFTK